MRKNVRNFSKRLFIYLLLVSVIFLFQAGPTAAREWNQGLKSTFPDTTNTIMIIGIKLKKNIPEVKNIIVKPGRLNKLRQAFLDIPPAGQNNRSLLYLRDRTGEILYKIVFDYPIARTVPMCCAGVYDRTVPDVIYIEEPEVFLLVPYFKEIKNIEIYNPYDSHPAAIEEFTEIKTCFDASSNLTLPFRECSPAEEGKLHVLLIASGFSASEMGTFADKAVQVRDYLLSKEPFTSYSESIEIHAYENLTDLECHTDCEGIDWLLCCNSETVISAAVSSGYLFDEIIVIHNIDANVGGGFMEYLDAYKSNSYTTFCTAGIGSLLNKTVLHEFGHSFGNLCDEYTYAKGQYSPMLCVNCRIDCNDWSSISHVCQQGCSARADFFRPENSIMLSLDEPEYNSVSIYANYLPDGLLKRLGYFIFTDFQLTIHASRHEEKAWLIARQYGTIDLNVFNPNSIPAAKYVIYRKISGGNFQAVKEILPSELQNGSCTYIDKFLDKNMTYTYKAEAFNSTGAVIGTSNEATI